jgi:pimeloyl-ACP methyl ester carboxylesterase
VVGAEQTAGPQVAGGVEFEPFFFGPANARLFGAHHPAAVARRAAAGIVICPPIGHEYINAHRCLRQLALRFASRGFPALRFDPYGIGDSAGDFVHASRRRWTGDVLRAIDELRRRTAVSEVALVGMRLGATLAAFAGAERGGVGRMVLWDPVVDGVRYLQEVTGEHEKVLKHLALLPTRLEAGVDTGLMGGPMTDALRRDLEAIDLTSLSRRPAEEILVVGTSEDLDYAEARRRLGATGARVEYRQMPGPRVWQRAPFEAVVPAEVLQAITGWVEGVRP